MPSYLVDFSFTAPGVDHLQMGGTMLEVDHPVATSGDVRRIAAEIGRQYGYTSVKVQGLAEAPATDPERELEPFTLDEG